MPRVIVNGGGVAGLSAAHELARRAGFEVVVYEQRALAGGKARSLDAIPGAGGRRALPGEHGFRFFPGFLDPDIIEPNPTRATNLEPLVVNTKGSWARRPAAKLPEVDNLFLASDYVRTYTGDVSLPMIGTRGRSG